MFQNRNKDVPQNPKQRDVFSSTIQNTHIIMLLLYKEFSIPQNVHEPPQKSHPRPLKKLCLGQVDPIKIDKLKCQRVERIEDMLLVRKMCMFLRLERRYVWQNFHKLRWKRGGRTLPPSQNQSSDRSVLFGTSLTLGKTNPSPEEEKTMRDKSKFIFCHPVLQSVQSVQCDWRSQKNKH